MKAKKETVCHNCRAQKIGCDGVLPSCTQCRLTGKRCSGYKLEAIFVPYSANSHSRRKSPLPVKSLDVDCTARTVRRDVNLGIIQLQGHQCQITRPIDTASSGELTAVIVSRFLPNSRKNSFSFDTSTSQVCGAWVEMLPGILARAKAGELVTAAARAFGLVVLDRGQEGKHKSFNSVAAYVATLKKLSSAMRSPDSFFRIETAASIACLAMVELMLPKLDSNTLAHFGGLSALINIYSPEVFASGDFHVIFVGCRPVLLLQAITARKASFLGEHEWLTMPFCNHSPSKMQLLISDAAGLPSILEEMDVLQTLSPDAAAQRAHKLRTRLSEVLGRLSRWDGQIEIKKRPYHMYPQNLEASHSQPDDASDFWFSSLLAANVSTHTWGFQIICFTELAKLSALFPNCDGNSLSGVGETWEGQNARLYALATKICQSMEYFLQDEMVLYGPAAAMWPLITAYNALITDVEGNKDQIKRYWEFLGRIHDKGFLSASVGTTDVRCAS